MKRSYSTVVRSVLCLALLATAAWAETKVPNESDPGDFSPQTNCDFVGDWKSIIQVPQLTIPDNNAAGVTAGPIQFGPDPIPQIIADVVIDLKLVHTYLGDLIVAIGYDETCDGVIDAQSIVLCRPRGTGATTPAPCGTGTGFGCSADLSCANTLLFDDSAASPLAEGTCVTPVAGGCYKPSTVGGSPLSVFRNRSKYGCWYINVADRAGADLGTLCEWSVHLLNVPAIGVEPANWGGVKVLYQ